MYLPVHDQAVTVCFAPNKMLRQASGDHVYSTDTVSNQLWKEAHMDMDMATLILRMDADQPARKLNTDWVRQKCYCSVSVCVYNCNPFHNRYSYYNL